MEESIPVSRRTRLQVAIKEKELREKKRQQWYDARSKCRKRVNKGVNFGKKKRVTVKREVELDAVETETSFVIQNCSVEKNPNLYGVDNDNPDSNIAEKGIGNAAETSFVGQNCSVDKNPNLGGVDDVHPDISIADKGITVKREDELDAAEAETSFVLQKCSVEKNPNLYGVDNDHPDSNIAEKGIPKEDGNAAEMSFVGQNCSVDKNPNFGGVDDDHLGSNTAEKGIHKEDGNAAETSFLGQNCSIDKNPNLGGVNDVYPDISIADEGLAKEDGNAVETGFVGQNCSVDKNPNLGGVDDVRPGFIIADEGVTQEDGNAEDSSDVEIIGERWNPDYCYESHSSLTGSGSDDENISVSREMPSFNFGSSSSRKEGKEEVSNAKVDEVNTDGNRLKSKDKHQSPIISNESLSCGFDWIREDPEKNDDQRSNFVCSRTRSRLKQKLSGKIRGNGSSSHPVTIDDSSSSNSDGEKNMESCDNARSREKDRPCKDNGFDWIRVDPVKDKTNGFDWIRVEPVNDKGSENVVKRKRGRPRKNRTVETVLGVQSDERGGLRTVNPIPEDGNDGLDMFVSSVSERYYLPLKFRFGDHNSLPEKSEEEEEIERLFNDRDFALRACDVGCSASCLDEEDNVVSKERVSVKTELCHQGNHDLIVEDEIGIRCKLCSFVKTETRYITSDFHDNPFGRIRRQEQPLFPY